MPVLVVTNNPMVVQKLSGKFDLLFDAGMDYEAVLKYVRDRVHKGAKLLSHPLSGSVKPGQTPYKTVLLEEGGNTLDQASLQIIEDALGMAVKMLAASGTAGIGEQADNDFKLIDYDLAKNALDQMMQLK